MCLLLTLMAAVAATVAWYACEKRKTYRLGTLCLIYWGAGLMWLVDFFFAVSYTHLTLPTKLEV